MDPDEQRRIEQYLNEPMSQGLDSEIEADNGGCYFSGIDSDDTDADPNYEEESIYDSSESEETDNEESTNRNVYSNNVYSNNVNSNNVESTIDYVIETYCKESGSLPYVGSDSLPSTSGSPEHRPSTPVSLDLSALPDPTNTPPAPPGITYVHPAPPSPPVVQTPPQRTPEAHPLNVVCQNHRMQGRNGHKWSNVPAQSNRTRTASRNIVHFRQGPVGEARNKTTPLEAFSLFFTDEMKDIILLHTNATIRRKQQNYSSMKATVSEITRDEFDAFLGVLVLTACQQDNHMATEKLFNGEFCGDRYVASMSCSRFDFLLECLRFDCMETREQRCREDRFAIIRDIWEMFIDACKNNYKPGSYLSIDEQLLAFRGRCKFRMYMPNKPAKYGIKLLMICDVGTKYMLNAMPYLGKNTTPRNVPQAQFFVKELSRPIHGTNRNLTMDNWFTTVSLASELLAPPYNLTIVGTLRRNKPEIPPEMRNPGNREVGTSMFCFDQQKTMVSYKTKRNKVVLLLSTIHSQPTINSISKKPEIIECYNQTKGAVDTLDQMCGQMSTSRKTRRWPLAVFFGMMNIMLVNSYVIYVNNMVSRNQKPVSRNDFAQQLHEQLSTTWMQHRLRLPTMSRAIRQKISAILKVDVPVENQQQQQHQGRKICGFCPSKKRRMTSHFCVRCSRAMCGEHQGKWCQDCTN